jgi:hypothetical protein
VTTVEVHLVEYASIPKVPNHSRNHVLEELMGDGLVDESPIAVASQCTGFL